MENDKQSLSKLTLAVELYFTNHSYSKARIRTYQKGWEQIKQFMLNHHFESYESKVADKFSF